MLEHENGHDLQINETIPLEYEDDDNIMLLNVIFGKKNLSIDRYLPINFCQLILSNKK